jgi:hypothetical protein
MKQQQFVFRSVVQSAFLSFCISGTCGCSAIGFGLGVAIDNSRPDKETIPVGTAMNLKPGDEIQISTKSQFFLIQHRAFRDAMSSWIA